MLNCTSRAFRSTFIKFILCPIILFFCRPFFSFTQNVPYTFRHITQSDGLLHSDVRGVVQDRKGFIWILTTNGLQRYDGSRFVNYPYDLNNLQGIGYLTSAQLFYDDRKDVLWISHPFLQKFEPLKNKFTTYAPESWLQGTEFYHEEYTDKQNNKWYSGDFGIVKYSDSEKMFIPYYFARPYLSTHISSASIRDKEKGETWIVSFSDGLSLLDKKSKRLYTHENNPIHHPLLQLIGKKHLSGIMEDSKKNIWIASGGQTFYKYSPDSKKLRSYRIKPPKKANNSSLSIDASAIVNCFFEDNHHKLWIGTDRGGLLCYNADEDSFATIFNENNSSDGLHYNFAIWSIMQDDWENIWIATDMGINIFNPYSEPLQTIRHQDANVLSLPKSEINCFIQTVSGDIITGTWGGGISIFDSQFRFKRTIHFAKPHQYNLVWSFIQNDDGTIWAGCQHGYIHIYDPVSGMVKTIRPPEVNHITIRCMAKDKAGNIYLGLHDGKVAVWKKKENKFYAYDNTKEPMQVFEPVLNIFFDSKNRCWVSTEYGLRQFDTKKFFYSEVYLPNAGNPSAISSYGIQAIEELNDSTLVIATSYGGLNFFNPGTKKFRHLTTAGGLPASTIYSLKKDSTNSLWLSTDFGLYKYNVPKNTFTNYYLQPGILTSPFKTNSFVMLKDGRWLTSTATELIAFRPAQNPIQKIPLKEVKITGFRVRDSVIAIDSFLAANRFVPLTYRQNFLRIEFALLNFSAAQQTMYYYRLSGIDKEWIAGGAQKFAGYTNLRPGDYTFSVKAETEAGISPETSFEIRIAPPFWRTWGFITGLSAAILLFMYKFIGWREQKIKAAEAQKLKVQQQNAEQYRSKLEMEQIINYFSSSLINKNTVDDVLWDVAKNLIGRLGFEDCILYLWNDEKTKMIQHAGYGPKGSIEEIQKHWFDVTPDQGVVGYVMSTKENVLIPDTSKDSRYRVDDVARQSELCIPVIFNNELLGIIDSEHAEKNFFTQRHLQLLTTIAALMAAKITAIRSEQSLMQAQIEMLGINEKLSEARLVALRSQMNPHFIFNCLNSIDDLIQNSEKEKATDYLAKFAKLLRSILETSKSNTVPCWKDVETLTVYLELEALRCDHKFSYHLNVAKEITEGDYKVPPLVIQPIVENAIHHGLLNKKDADRQLFICITVENNCVHYTIEDNGVGRALSSAYNQINKPTHQSMGMQITTDRINLFNEKAGAAVTITDLYNSQLVPAGTRVEVVLNYQ